MDYKKRTINKTNFQQQYDRYIAMAREAVLSGDRVLAENYYQYAEHFLRIINERTQVRYTPPVSPSHPRSDVKDLKGGPHESQSLHPTRSVRHSRSPEPRAQTEESVPEPVAPSESDS